MTDFLIYFAFSVVSYLLGSINTGILVSKILYNDDVRNYGSHNAGATNILRTYGKKAAAITVLGDALKGVIAILLVRLVYFCFKNAHLPDLRSVTYFAAFFAVLGHNFPVYFKFKGGKGVLTSITVIIMLDPFVGLATLVISLWRRQNTFRSVRLWVRLSRRRLRYFFAPTIWDLWFCAFCLRVLSFTVTAEIL